MATPRNSHHNDANRSEDDKGHLRPVTSASSPNSSIKAGEDLLAGQGDDPALVAKMHLVNDAIDQIGWTPYHWKLFFLNGFGYAVDSLVLLLQSIIAGNAYKEIGGGGYERGMTVAIYTGMLLGALFWGFGADIIGRRWAFNGSLFVCAIATLVAGAMPTWESLGVFIALSGFGCGGNLILDTTVFLEYLPSKKQWVLTSMALWWGFGQFIAGCIGWGFLSADHLNCDLAAATCRREDNWGWRYVLFTSGALILFLSILRITIVRLKETPKYMLGMGEDAAVVDTLQGIALKYNRPCDLTLEQLRACGELSAAHNSKRLFLFKLGVHLRGLFSSPKVGLSTGLLFASWTLMGLAYPLFYMFLPEYLRSRGVVFNRTEFQVWRNYAITNICGIPSPILAGYMVNTRLLGRRYTMVIGALLTMVFFFGYTAVTTDAQDVAFTCTIAFCLNIYYGTLFAYTPEVLPSAHRATGNGIAVSLNRIMGIMSAVVATVANTGTPAPIYVCGSLFVCLAILATALPFEPYGRRSS